MRNVFVLLLWTGLCTASSSAQQQSFTYTLRLTDPTLDRVEIVFDTGPFREEEVRFFLPAWAPGNYYVNDYGRWIDSVRAFDSLSRPLKVHRAGINEWRIGDARRLARITYTARDIPEDSLESLPTTLNEITPRYFYANGPTVFGYVDGHLAVPCSLRTVFPADWKVWSSLDSVAPFGFHADDYDQLIDCPVLAGPSTIEEHRFEVNGVPYIAVFNSETKVPSDSLVEYMKSLISYHTAFFNEVPFRQYYFLFNFFVSTYRYGALEHSNSSAYFLRPPVNARGLRHSTITQVIAHEFFHLWNPKIITPTSLKPFKYQEGPRVHSMWFIEGLTEYYAKLALIRSGLVPRSFFYEQLRGLALENSRENLEQLGLKAGELGVAPSMYTKGALVSFLLDIAIRDQTGNQKSLDDVVLALNRQFGHEGRPYDDRALIKTMEKLAGVDLRRFFKKYISGTDAVPVDEYFRKGGLLYTYVYPPFLGWGLDVDEGGQLFVNAVAEQSTAAALGVRAGDIVRRINGTDIPADLDSVRSIMRKLDSVSVGEPVRVVVERDGASIDLHGTVIGNPLPNVGVVEDPDAGATATAIREGIFRIP
jgi:predicted metalloprotease with PDZ domain